MIPSELQSSLRTTFRDARDPMSLLNELRAWLSKNISVEREMPVDCVQWVPLEKVQANDYNPNTVAVNELRLLYVSIDHDGYTQPVVTVYNEEADRYVIVDGFHRYFVMKSNGDLLKRTGGLLPVVVLHKGMNDRMASTIRHNRARGKHSIAGMSNVVFNLLDNGWDDAAICGELGMEPDELIRLKYITGFAKLFDNVEYRKSWETKRQIQLREAYRKEGKV